MTVTGCSALADSPTAEPLETISVVNRLGDPIRVRVTAERVSADPDAVGRCSATPRDRGRRATVTAPAGETISVLPLSETGSYRTRLLVDGEERHFDCFGFDGSERSLAYVVEEANAMFVEHEG